MASAFCPDDVLQASEGKTRFVRLARLLMCGGTTVMRELFDFFVPPANLATVLTSLPVQTRLQQMKHKKWLTSTQWQVLYPSGACVVQSTSFDITLLFKLLRENAISGLSPPSTGWDTLPNISNLSLPADMARIKYYRNAIAHGDEKMELEVHEFTDYWNEIKDALVRIVDWYALSGSSTARDWETAIDKLLTEPLTEDDRKNVEELKSWYLDERELKQMVQQLLQERKCQQKESLQEKEGEQRSRFVVYVRCVMKIASVSAWLGGTVYVLNLLEDNPQLLIDYVKYAIIPTGVAFASFAFGSIKIGVQAETVEALDQLWKRYKTSQLKEDFEKIMLTGELKTLANGKRIELSVEMSEEEYLKTRKFLREKEVSKASLLKSFCVLPPKPSHQSIDRLEEVTELLKQMERLRNENNGITLVYLSGSPGCGKTELARQIGERFFTDIASQTMFVFTFNASSTDTLSHSYIEFARIVRCTQESIPMVVTSKDTSPKQKIVQLKDLVATKLDMYSSWMMIVDNVTDLEMVSRYFPKMGEKTSGNGQILVTTQESRAMEFCSCNYHFSLSFGMKPVEAVKILTNISVYPSDKDIILKVEKALDFQPLAMACAATYMRHVYSRESSMTWTKFLEELQSRKEKLTTESANVKSSSPYPVALRVAVMMALEEEMTDSMLMLTFQFLSVMAPEPILLKYVVQYVKACQPVLDDEVVASRISSSSLIRISLEDSSTVSVNRVVHDCLQILTSQNRESFEIEFLKLLKILKAFPLLSSYRKDSFEKTVSTSSLLVHFVSFAKRLHECVGDSLSDILLKIPLDKKKEYFDTEDYLSIVGGICYSYGNCKASKIYQKISLAIQEHRSDQNNPTRLANTLNILGLNLCDVGQDQEAIKCFQKALVIQERAYGINDPCLVNTLNNLGVNHRIIGQYQEANLYLVRALSIQEKAYDENYLRLATTLNNLGLNLRHLGHYKKANACFERSLTIQDKANNENDPRLFTALNNLGLNLRDLGHHQEAKTCLERALTIQEKACDESDPRLATTLNNLAVNFSDLGQHQVAKAIYERALTIQEKAYDESDLRLATTLNNLGLSFRHLGEHKRAQICLERSLTIQAKAYDENDPRLATSLNNLGLNHRDLGQHKEAKACFQRVLTIQDKANNENDPRLSTALNNLGINLRHLGQYTRANACFERALTIQDKVNNENDPRLSTALNNLGLNLRDLGHHQEAKTCFERALAIQEKSNNDKGPLYVTTLTNLAVNLSDLGQHQVAKAIYKRALTMQEKAYDESDLRLATTLNNLGLNFRHLGEHKRAQICLERAFTIQAKAYDENDPRLATSLNNLGLNLSDLGQHQEAKACFQRALAIQEKAYD